ncbi:hypothetical protein FSP39_024119 [Pinctada imbricata]|uniref:BRISC and BRCA1-A complex member 2 n=1 Tax=Pinctada imbricata TaxID=66713 RepID=A0AA88Y4L2_PINIB|nr:hypothetical protein FSP39_024119 [Pinctada imbricata]
MFLQTKLGPVNFLIKLPVDYTQIPAYVTKDNPGTDTSVLLLTLPHPDSARITPQLYLSPRVEHALGGSSSLRIPAFPNGGLMGDYVVGISQLLQNKVDQIVQNFDRRRDYMAALLSYFGRSVLEFDADTFRKISLLFEWNDFFFILHIEVPQFFPQEKPILSFQSIYHECKGKPYTEVHEEYPYSPRWSGSEMAERARVYILDNIKDFQIQSVRSGVL